MKKNGILTFLFAFVPGAGQMYQGYMKRGLSLITMFCLFIIVGSATGLDALVVGCIVVYMYSFFDTFNLRAQIIAENAPADDYLVHINWKDKRMQDFMMDSHKLLGWGLIALGGLVAYENVIMRVFGDVMWRWGQNNPVFRAFYLMLDELPQIVTCVALIVCGLWLVRGPKGKKVHRKKAEEPEDEDFREYTAAEADAPEAPEETADFAMPKLSALLGDPVTPEDPEEPEQPENKPTEKVGNGDCLVGASRYRMGQMRTNGDILGHLLKGVDNASIFVPQSDETVTKTLDNELADEKNTDTPQAIETEFEMEFETEDSEEPDVSPDEIEAEEIACYMGEGEPEMAQGVTLGELGQMVQVIQVKQASETEERQAVQTICRTETNLFQSLVEQINGGRSRVAELLQKHEIPVPVTVPAAGNNEMADFDMNDFL